MARLGWCALSHLLATQYSPSNFIYSSLARDGGSNVFRSVQLLPRNALAQLAVSRAEGCAQVADTTSQPGWHPRPDY